MYVSQVFRVVQQLQITIKNALELSVTADVKQSLTFIKGLEGSYLTGI